MCSFNLQGVHTSRTLNVLLYTEGSYDLYRVVEDNTLLWRHSMMYVPIRLSEELYGVWYFSMYITLCRSIGMSSCSFRKAIGIWTTQGRQCTNTQEYETLGELHWQRKLKHLGINSTHYYRSFWYKPTQDRQCTRYITFRCVHTTVVVVEKQYVLHIVSVCL